MNESVFSTPKSSSTFGKFVQIWKLSDGTVKTYVCLQEAQPSGKLLNSILHLTVKSYNLNINASICKHDLIASQPKTVKDVIMKMIMDCNIDSIPTRHATFIIPDFYIPRLLYSPVILWISRDVSMSVLNKNKCFSISNYAQLWTWTQIQCWRWTKI